MSIQTHPLPSRFPSRFPPITNQASYFVTGGLAGACTLPIELYYQKPASIASFLRTAAAAPIYRVGVRFWTFTHVRHQLADTSLPIWTVGGLGGAAGGFNEVCTQSMLNGRLPHPRALGSQSLKLFFCFGTYTFLSTSLSDTLPPKPFGWCWMMGLTAGAVGSGIVAALEGVRGKALWAGALPRGSVTVGTVIAVQVTSVAVLLELVER